MMLIRIKTELSKNTKIILTAEVKVQNCSGKLNVQKNQFLILTLLDVSNVLNLKINNHEVRPIIYLNSNCNILLESSYNASKFINA